MDYKIFEGFVENPWMRFSLKKWQVKRGGGREVYTEPLSELAILYGL
jgi:hypothetical protein